MVSELDGQSGESRDQRILGDIRVLELSEGIPGAVCGKLLAGLGADVIKVEPPGGERGRMLGPFAGDHPHPEKSGTFLYLNMAKRGVTLDLTVDEGRDLFRRLAERADVVVESFRPGTLAGWRLDYAAMSELNPRLIVASITPFGQDGPYRDYLIDEIVAEALGGLMYFIGLPEREPLKIGGNPALHNAGIAAFSAIMAAIWQRDGTGEGQHIDVSIMEATAMSQIHASIEATWQGTNMQRRASVLLPTSDGWASVGMEMGVSADTWPRFCALIGRPDLTDDERFATSAVRRDNRDALQELVSKWVSTRPKMQVYHELQRLRSIAGYVATAPDLQQSEQLRQRGFFQEIDHPVVGTASYPGAPFKVGDAVWVQRPAPLLGEHNEVVFREELGLDPGALLWLRERGVI